MFSLPALPYAYDALEPVIGQTTMRTHHDKHHQTYVTNLNKMLAEQGSTPESLEAVIEETASEGGKLFNNAGQAWNHAFFWECMTPDKSQPTSQFAALRDRFIEEGAGHFGSGWVWIAVQQGELTVLTTHDGDTLARQPQLTPVLVCDLWEHAYYLDYKNDRKGFLSRWFDEIANWRFAESQLKAAQGQGELYRYPRPTNDKDPLGQASEVRA
ncbi:MAG TPA: superoxide dismutase [Caulobacteraceae bacterium]|nr:superoxide dismutase [Caulobacteraceae bacterium]